MPILVVDPAPWHAFLTEYRFLGNLLWQWAALLGVILVSLVVGKIAGFVIERQAQRLRDGQRLPVVSMLLHAMVGPVALLAIAGGLYVAGHFMVLKSEEGRFDVTAFWLQVCTTLAVLAAGWFIYRVVDIVEFYLLRWTGRSETLLDDQLVPLLRKSLRVFVVIVVALFIAQNVFAWDIGALIAGLGIGGLAVALAAKDMLANLFGSVTILADRPFQLNDWVKIGNYEGTIEEVGFRSTRLRTFYGHLVTLPNANVAQDAIENVAARPFIRRNLNVTVTYDTSPEKLQQGLDILKDMLAKRKASFAPDKEPKALFSDFNADSLNLLVVYWFQPNDYWQFQAFNHEFNLELLRRFNEAGIEFAFPTQTLYLKPDGEFDVSVRP